ncbi:PPE family protein, SVP subgroup [Mycobacterium tuberculosis]
MSAPTNCHPQRTTPAEAGAGPRYGFRPTVMARPPFAG